MMMFCGLPVIVATEPIFEAVARPTRYGIGGRFRRWQRWSTSGVNATQTTSLTRNAERTPEMAIVTARRLSGPENRAATCSVASAKKPAMRRYATTTIMPKSRTIVS